jgi:hypothetical protein
MTASWPAFVVGAALVFFLFNAIFAFFYWIDLIPLDRRSANLERVRAPYIDYFYFSIEMLSTAGCGDMHPQSHYGHFIAGHRALHRHLLDVVDDRADLCALLATERAAIVRQQSGRFEP